MLTTHEAAREAEAADPALWKSRCSVVCALGNEAKVFLRAVHLDDVAEHAAAHRAIGDLLCAVMAQHQMPAGVQHHVDSAVEADLAEVLLRSLRVCAQGVGGLRLGVA